MVARFSPVLFRSPSSFGGGRYPEGLACNGLVWTCSRRLYASTSDGQKSRKNHVESDFYFRLSTFTVISAALVFFVMCTFQFIFVWPCKKRLSFPQGCVRSWIERTPGGPPDVTSSAPLWVRSMWHRVPSKLVFWLHVRLLISLWHMWQLYFQKPVFEPKQWASLTVNSPIIATSYRVLLSSLARVDLFRAVG